jgi:hypothetical protein
MMFDKQWGVLSPEWRIHEYMKTWMLTLAIAAGAALTVWAADSPTSSPAANADQTPWTVYHGHRVCYYNNGYRTWYGHHQGYRTWHGDDCCW